jgi:hypothetical protein
MATEDDIARAARRSREWKARQAEIADALREDAEIERRRRAIRDSARAENYNENVWRNVVFALLAGAVGLVFFEQQSIDDSATKCFAGAARPGQYRCADRIAASPWFWLLPKDTRELIKISRSDGR